MATFSFGATPGAPGTYINETTGNVATAGIASFSTVYMLVETEESVPVINFPFNKPIAITSLRDYQALIGGAVPQERIPLLSFNCVNAFFQNAQVGDLRVVRVGTPNQIVEIEVLASGTKISNSGIPSQLEAGDVVYAQLVLNGQRLVAGDGSTGYSSDGDWYGVPVTIPVDYIAGDAVNNRKISKAIAMAVAAAIESNPSIRSSIYVRDYGLISDIDPTSTSENAFLNIAAASYGGSVTVVTQQEPVGSKKVLMNNTYDVQNIVGLESTLTRVPQDYIQCINTAFDGQQNQGYLIAPTAYAQFDAAGRTAIGAAAATHCQSNNFKWMALADAGPYLVTDINKYSNFTPHLPADDLVTGMKYLVDNAIYEWTGVDVTYDKLPYQAIIRGFNPKVAVQQSREAIAEDEKVGLIDPATFTLASQVGFAEDGKFIVSSSSVWPATFRIMEVTTENLGADFAGLGSTVYIVAPDYNTARYGPYPSNGTQQIVYIAETAAAASSVYTEVTANGGSENMGSAPADALTVATPTGSTIEVSYGTPAWDLLNQVSINGQSSNLIQNITTGNQYVNTVHLPGTLQDSTQDFRLNFFSRTFLDPSAAGVVTSLTISGTAYCQLECIAHGLKNGQQLFFTKPLLSSSGTVFKATNVNGTNPYFVKVIDNDFIVLASSYADYLAGSYVPYAAIVTDTPVIAYSKVLGGELTAINLAELSTLAMMRGRKYGFASGTIADEAAYADATPASGSGVPVSIYMNESSVVLGEEQIFPYGETSTAEWLPKLDLVAPGLSNTDVANFVCTPTVDQKFGTEAYLVPAIDPIYGGDYEASTTAALGVLDTTTDYTVALGLSASDTGSDIQAILTQLDGVYFEVTTAAPGSVGPDNVTPVVAGDRIVVTFDGSSYNWVVVPAEANGGDLTSVAHVCYGSQVEISLTAEQTPPSNLWRFDAITSTEIIDSALRGVGFNGDPQAKFIEAGVDSVNRLYEDSQRYFNAFGFIAYYGPYINNASGQAIPLSAYVTGVALRRYRAEGFQFPPAGVKYQLADAISVQIPVNSAQQNLLNPDGCNVARTLPGYADTAVFIWGGRTRINKTVAEQLKFQFVNTRVIQNVVYGSLRNAFDNQIFSVIDGFGVIFNQITTIGNSVLNQLWAAGALYGSLPSDAYQIICDDRINKPENLENGLIYVKVFDVPVPTLERIEVDLIRVSIGQMGKELASQGLF